MDSLFLDRPVYSWFIAPAAFVLVILGVPLLRRLLVRRCGDVSGSFLGWRTLVCQLNAKWMRLTTIVMALAIATLFLEPPPVLHTIAKGAIVVMLAVQVVRLVPVLLDWTILRILHRTNRELATPAGIGTLTGVRWLLLLVVYSIVFLLALQNLDIDVTAMIAGLGIGGIAVALAMQNILGDLFGSLTIALDKPFVIGDFIVVGSEMGTVEYIGLKTTRLRSLSGEQLVFSNSDLLSSRVRNYKRMNERRVLFAFGVTYDTPPEQLETIPEVVRTLVESTDGVRFDRCHFHRFGESSLDFETVYYIASPDYNAHMDAQQAIHLGIARAFRARGIDFAFPTRTLHLVGQVVGKGGEDEVAPGLRRDATEGDSASWRGAQRGQRAKAR